MQDMFVPGLILDERFEAVSPLNHGSFGMVFLARDMVTDESVAIKCLAKIPTSHDTANAADDHLVELGCHDRLGVHPNIVNLLHSFETDTHRYLVLEFCSMGDLYEAILSGRGPLQTEKVREFMLQLVNAVEFMHSKGLYHRDIKPENIFLTPQGLLKLGDFGLATADSWSYEASVGSDRYMAPEQYDPGDFGYSPAQADIWAVGVCLVNVLFSRNLFITPTEADPRFMDYVRDNRSLYDMFPTLSPDTFHILEHALALDPAKRSLDAVRARLQAAVNFKTDDVGWDEPIADDREMAPPSANREPLRTPSLPGPHVEDGGAFPWSPPRPIRPLSAIADTESYTEDLFPVSERDRSSWYSVTGQTASLASGIDSILGTSATSMVPCPPPSVPRQPSRPGSAFVAASGSGSTGAIPPLPAVDVAFGREDGPVSKSWADLWDEEEEERREREADLERRRAHNGRTYSQGSKDDDPALGQRSLVDLQSPSRVDPPTDRPHHDPSVTSLGGANEPDGVVVGAVPIPKPNPPPYSPPPKRFIMDKWAALGHRRRAYLRDSEGSSDEKRASVGNWRRGLGMKVFSGNMVWGKGKEKENGGTRGRSWREVSLVSPASQLPASHSPAPHSPAPHSTTPHLTTSHSPTPHLTTSHPSEDPGEFEWVGGWHGLHS